MTGLRGGCLCGAVRYRLASAPYDAGWCHCRICQKASGAPGLVFATVPHSDFVVDAGEAAIATVTTSEYGERQFCRRCGTPLTIHVAFQPDEIDIAVATLDEPDRVAPTFHIFDAGRIAWDTGDDGLPRHARFRPRTRGLDGTDPPA